MTAEQLPSRRELREAQRLSELAGQQGQVAPVATRRQIRELERAQQPVAVLPPVAEPAVPVLAPVRPRIRSLPTEPPVLEPVVQPVDVELQVAPPIVQPPVQPPVQPVSDLLPNLTRQLPPGSVPTSQPWSLTDTGSIFTMSPTPGVAPQTASIVIATPFDPLSFTGPIPTAGARTGSITIPSLASATAEVSLAKAANDADLASALDSSGAYVAGIPPIAAAGVIRSRSKESAFPQKLRRGKGQLYLVLTTVLLMAAVLGLTLAAFLLGIFN